MSNHSIEAITPAYDFSPMSPTLKRLVELAVQARRDAAFLGLDRARPEAEATPVAGPATQPEPAAAPYETGRLDLRA